MSARVDGYRRRDELSATVADVESPVECRLSESSVVDDETVDGRPVREHVDVMSQLSVAVVLAPVRDQRVVGRRLGRDESRGCSV